LSTVSPSAPRPRSFFLIGIALAAVGAVLLSTRAILIKLAYGYNVDPITFLTLRMVFSLPFFAAAAIWTQRQAHADSPKLSTRDKWSVVGLGLLGYYFASYVDFVGLQYISAALARLIQFLNPTLTILILALFMARKVVLREVLALVVCYAGIALCLAHDVRMSGSLSLTAFGASLSLLSALRRLPDFFQSVDRPHGVNALHRLCNDGFVHCRDRPFPGHPLAGCTAPAMAGVWLRLVHGGNGHSVAGVHGVGSQPAHRPGPGRHPHFTRPRLHPAAGLYTLERIHHA
jgi:hypothetical protein